MNRIKLSTGILAILLVTVTLVPDSGSLLATTNGFLEGFGLKDATVAGTRSNSQSSTTTVTLSEGPAWIASKELERVLRAEPTSDDRWRIAMIEALRDFYASNPNTLTSPMGKLCWAHHELYRTLFLRTEYALFHQLIIPSAMQGVGISATAITPSPGSPEASLAVINLLDARRTAGSLEFEDPDGLVKALRTWNAFVGTGSDWITAIRTVATSEEFEAVSLPTGGLPADVRAYAAALVALAKEQNAAESPSLEIETLLALTGYNAFHTAAKTSSDCTRIHMDVGNEALSDDTSTTTTAVLTTSTTVSSTEGRPGVPRDVSITRSAASGSGETSDGTPPDTPGTNPIISSVVSWLPPDTGGPVENYVVRIAFVLSEGRGLFEHTEVTSSLTFDATSLIDSHGSEYSVKILAYNADGRSRWTDWIRPVTSITLSHRDPVNAQASEEIPSYTGSLVEIIDPCVPIEGSERDPCEVGDPPIVEILGVSSEHPWSVTTEIPTISDILLGLDLPIRTPHIVVRATIETDTTRCELYLVSQFDYEATSDLLGHLHYYMCFADARINEYLLGSGPARLTIAMHRESVVLANRQDWAEVKDEWVNKIWEDPETRVAEAYEGREIVMFLRPALTLAVETWAVGGSFDMWFVQRATPTADVMAVEQSSRLARTEQQRTKLSVVLQSLKTKVAEAASERTRLTGGRIGMASTLPQLVTDAGRLRDFYVAEGADYDGDDRTTVMPPPVPGHETAATTHAG